MVYSVTITAHALTRRLVRVPAEGTGAAGVRSVVNMVRASVRCRSAVGSAARGLSIPGLSIRGISIGGALVAVLVLGGPGLPSQPCRHPIHGELGHSLELHVLQGDDQESRSGSTDSHKGSKNKDLHL